jgi:hypothetical protein
MQGTRRTTNSSISGVQSFRPELEFEVIKIVVLRENYLKRIAKCLVNSKGKVDMGVIGIVDTLRDCSIECVDTIQTWERTQVDYPTIVKPFLWNGENYLEKMCKDHSFLNEYPLVEKWLGFHPECNPFFIPPEALESETDMKPNSFVVFGVRPPPPPTPPRAKPILPKFVKSPYLTPIHNDLDIFPENSAINKSKSKAKLLSAAQAAADKIQSIGKDQAKDALTDPYQSFVDCNAIRQAKAMYKVLLKTNNGIPLYTTAMGGTGMGNSSFEGSISMSFVTAVEIPSTTSANAGAGTRTGGIGGSSRNGNSMPPGPGSPMKVSDSSSGAGAGSLPPAPAMKPKATALGSQLDGDSLELDGSIDDLPPAISGGVGQDQIQGSIDEQQQQSLSPLSPNRPVKSATLKEGELAHFNEPAASSPMKQSVSATISTTGSHAGRLGSTSLFSQNRNDFEATQDGFRQTLDASSEIPSIYDDNKAMRMDSIAELTIEQKSQLQFTSKLDTSMSTSVTNATTNQSKLWTPHEITLQRAVRRRGGELFVLTAAGTKGHIKAPTRRTRYERLQKEMTTLLKQSEDLKSIIETKSNDVKEMRNNMGFNADVDIDVDADAGDDISFTSNSNKSNKSNKS